ncbi:restriction endonuclease subunit S [Amycolatopsis balhimycina DSM 5908]|uniref:Restriction endonuclease subunit S n=1 Tax=Amycolatopsis balhimycina DSM 5908 TaxID=1081091 RepID=A0A428WFS5_AMYBA|nr:restriction endonuclease subunit S [Amycolatopsis balhimycina]RSM41900.1 restriction endonuclease subunit S [Amycolatopsis balhimycina DSM 5908]
MSDNEKYDLVSIRRRYGGLFYRETLKGRDIFTKTLRRIVPGAFIIARMQVVHGAVAYVSEDFEGMCISKSYSQFVGRPGCSTKYFSMLAQSPMMAEYFMDASHGVVIEKMTFDQDRWLDFNIVLPPIDEQCKIVDTIDAVDARIAVAEEGAAKLDMLKAALYQSLFDDDSLPFVPLSEVAEIRNGSTPSRIRKDYWQRGSIAWLASGKVNDYRITTPSEPITERAVSECHLRILPAGSVVVGMIGQGKTRGMAARVEINAAINQNLAGIVPGLRLRGAYLHHYLVHSYQKLRSGGRGSNQDALTTGLVAQFKVPVPTAEEQQRIASVLDALDQRISAEREVVAKLTAQKGGLLADLLRGRVRVPLEVIS